jgi:hypothetical protein
LPLNLLCAYLAQSAYQLGDFKLAEAAADKALSYFTEKTEYVDRAGEKMTLHAVRLRQAAVRQVSLIELQHLA